MKSNLFAAICMIFFSTPYQSDQNSLLKVGENNTRRGNGVITTVPLYRLCDDKGYHMYITDKSIKDQLLLRGQKKGEGIVGYVFLKQVRESVRLYGLKLYLESHKATEPYSGIESLYTTDEDEMLYARGKFHYQLDDGFNAYISTAYVQNTNSIPPTKPLYRILQLSLQPQGHFYTTNTDERNALLKDTKNYRDEGIAGYVWEGVVSLEEVIKVDNNYNQGNLN